VRRDPVGAGQESVRDHPRPPSAEVTPRRIVVELNGRILAETDRAVRVWGADVVGPFKGEPGTLGW
jgi:uncharacterized protein (DUF427 family)